MTNVLLIVTADYPDMAAVHERILAGSKKEGVMAYRRKNDRVVKGIAEVLGLEIPEATSEWWLRTRVLEVDSKGETEIVGHKLTRSVHFGGNAYLEEMLNTMSYIVVYGTPDSTVTKYWIDKATDETFSIMYGDKIELNIAKAKKTRKKATRKVEA